ncbi:hypothetical protein [Promicromonospora sp. NFX87]|uniref:hypothetical protein n=1 Tax=Promicromonospora sp. NFX87 TaxID=3402691 RepID=UPI003AFB7206
MIRDLVTLVVQELMRPMRRSAALDPEPGRSGWDHLDSHGPRQARTCPFCNAWFNTTAQQDAHEHSCDQRPTNPTPAEVLDLALPPHYASIRHPLHQPEGEHP